MPRRSRQCPGGFVYHVWNRAAGRQKLFSKDLDYLAFEKILLQAHGRHPLRILDYCLMPTHWHFVVYPHDDDDVTNFFRWLTHTHAMRAIAHRRQLGYGPLYQGRFKTLMVQKDEHLLTLLRYVQRNPLRAGLVKRVEKWEWSGQYVCGRPNHLLSSIMSPWPIDRPADWDAWLHRPQTDAEVEELREHIRRGRPFGSPRWTKETAARFHAEWTLRPRGRPRGDRDDSLSPKTMKKGT